MKKIALHIIVFSLLLLSFTGCFKDDVVIDPDQLTTMDRPLNIAVPIVNASFKATDMLDRMSDSISDFISVEDDGLICIKYTDSVNAVWDEIIELEEVEFSKDYPISILDLKSNIETITYEERIKLNTEPDQRFDSMYIESSQLSLGLEFPTGYSGDVNVKFPGLIKDGVSLEFNFDLSDSNPTETTDLAGYDLYFDQGVDSSYFTMLITANVDVPTPTLKKAGNNISVTLSLSSMVPEVLFGYFGQNTILDSEESMEFQFFEELDVVDLIEFKDIKLNLSFDNYFGIPFDGVLVEALVIRESTKDTLNLELNEDNVIPVEEATYAEPVIPTFNSYIFDETNSNIGDAVNLFPDKLDYHLQANINTGTEESTNFITQDNRIAGNVEFIIPLWLRTQAYHRYDTIHEFDLIESISEDQLAYLDSANLYLIFTNSFPFELFVQIYFADDNYNNVDSLFAEQQQFLASGELDSEDKVTEDAVTEVTISLTKEQIEKYKELSVTRLILKTETTTANSGTVFVKILDSYGLDFELNVDLQSAEISL